jgi:hypothetical protein
VAVAAPPPPGVGAGLGAAPQPRTCRAEGRGGRTLVLARLAETPREHRRPPLPPFLPRRRLLGNFFYRRTKRNDGMGATGSGAQGVHASEWAAIGPKASGWLDG